MASSLIKDQIHPADMLALYVQVDGVLTDVYEAKFAIFDESSAIPGTAGLTGTVTTGAGHFLTGCYGVYDAVNVRFWKPTSTIKRGRVEWSYKLASTDSAVLVTRYFEVLEATVASRPAQTLVLLQDVKDFGTIGSATDTRLRTAILEWRDVIERYCKQRFRPVRETRRFRGTGSSMLFLPEPVFGVSEFYANSETTKRLLTEFTFYGATGNDRRNPKMEWALSEGSIFAPSGGGTFVSGLIQKLSAVVGFIEEDTLGAPLAVQEAMIRGVRLGLRADLSGGSAGSPGGVIKREETDGHAIEYAVSSGSAKGGFLSILKDPAIRDALTFYVGPISLAAPSVD